jgi:methyl-accepting chemotaxis protein
MTEIVSSVQHVSRIIDEISDSTRLQSRGIGELGSAVNELDQMTQQNAALVEQSAAAADSLKQQRTSSRAWWPPSGWTPARTGYRLRAWPFRNA